MWFLIQSETKNYLQTEYNLLKQRQRDFAAAINAEDDVIYGLIEHCSAENDVKTEMAAIWDEDTKSEETKIKEEWKVKITGMKIAYEKDKTNLAELNQQRALKFSNFGKVRR